MCYFHAQLDVGHLSKDQHINSTPKKVTFRKNEREERETHIMLLAITALLSFPFVISHKFKRSRMTVTKNLFSWK